MATYNITQDDIYLLKSHKLIHIKVYLLNDENMIVDELQGYVTSGDYSDDASSDVRKTCNFSMHSYDSTYDIGEYNRIWLKNRVRIDLGFEYFDRTIWYTKGIYIFDSCSYTYDGSTRDITFQCSDLVSTINGTHGGTVVSQCTYCDIPLNECKEHRGQVFGTSLLIKGCTLNEETGLYEGNDIKKVVEDLLEQNGITEYKVDTIGQVSCLQGYAVNWKQNRIDTGTTKDEADIAESTRIDDLENDHGTWHMIPYDLEFDKEVTLWDILVKIRDLYPGYEMFFDKDGMFVFQLIPICHHDIDVLDAEVMEGLVISENTDYDLTTVRNATKVYGQNIEPDRYSEDTQIIDAIYQRKELQDNGEEITVEENVKSIKVNFIVGDDESSTVLQDESEENEGSDETEETVTFVKKDGIVIGVLFSHLRELGTEEELSKINAYLTIKSEGVDETLPIKLRKAIVSEDENGVATNEIVYNNMQYSSFYQSVKNSTTNENGELIEVIEEIQDIYCFKYLKSQNIWVYAGMYQIEGYYENNNPESPFSIDKIGYRLQIKSGGEYENITTSTLAQERAEYENWITSRLTDTITIESVIIPFLEVNQKIQYRKLSNGSVDSYIINSLSASFIDGTMTITMNKFYELDPFIVCS